MRIARDELRRIRELTRSIDALERELAALVAELAPQLLAEHGCGVLTAAKLIGEIAGIGRFATDAKLARARRRRHRSPHPRDAPTATAWTAAATASSTARCTASPSPRAACDPETAAYLARKQAEGKSRREALRCLKRHLARRVWRLLQPPRHAQPHHRHRPAHTHHHDPLQHAIQPLLIDIGATIRHPSRRARARQPPFAAVMYVQHALNESRPPKIVSIAWRMIALRSLHRLLGGLLALDGLDPPTQPSTAS